jgi:hypothetical protein
MSQPEMGQAGEWRVAVKGEQRGPFTLEQLRAMIAEARLPPDALFWRPGLANWAPMSGVPELGVAGRGPVPGAAASPFAGPTPGAVAVPASPSPFGEFLAFRRMVTPVVIQVIFWIGAASCLLAGLLQLFFGLRFGSVMSILGALFTIVAGPLFVRVWCELIILLFRIYDTLQEIKEQRK